MRDHCAFFIDMRCLGGLWGMGFFVSNQFRGIVLCFIDVLIVLFFFKKAL